MNTKLWSMIFKLKQKDFDQEGDQRLSLLQMCVKK